MRLFVYIKTCMSIHSICLFKGKKKETRECSNRVVFTSIEGRIDGQVLIRGHPRITEYSSSFHEAVCVNWDMKMTGTSIVKDVILSRSLNSVT